MWWLNSSCPGANAQVLSPARSQDTSRRKTSEAPRQRLRAAKDLRFSAPTDRQRPLYSWYDRSASWCDVARGADHFLRLWRQNCNSSDDPAWSLLLVQELRRDLRHGPLVALDRGDPLNKSALAPILLAITQIYLEKAGAGGRLSRGRALLRRAAAPPAGRGHLASTLGLRHVPCRPLVRPMAAS